MRKFSNWLMSAAACSLLHLSLQANAAAQDLTVVSWGGSYTEAESEAYFRDFMQDTGERLRIEDYSGGLAEVRAQVEAGNVRWDVVEFDLQDVVAGCQEGLLEQIPMDQLEPGIDGTPAEEDFLEGTLHECGVGKMVWSTVIAYDKTRVDEPPTSVEDFFDLEAYPGRRGLRRSPIVAFEWALMADGVPASEVYALLATPEGVDRALRKLDTIKEHTVWWEAGAQPAQLLDSGEVVMTSIYNGRAFNAIRHESQPFAIVWDGQVQNVGIWGIPKGTDNLEAALELVRYTTQSEPLARLSNQIGYGPARQSSFPLVEQDVRSDLPTSPDNMQNALQNDPEFWADHRSELEQRFVTWLAN